MKNNKKSKNTLPEKIVDEIVTKWKEDKFNPFEWGNTYFNIKNV